MIELKEKVINELLGYKFYQENASEVEKILGIGEPLREGDYFQQGDCILAQLGDTNFIDAPTEIKGEKQSSNIILNGLINSHCLYEGDYEIYKDGEDIYVDVKSFAILDHVKDDKVRSKGADNHHPQYIPAGKYFFRGVLEFDHLEKMARQVID